MKERPILFSGQMVKAILAGRKTQTRRIIRDTLVHDLPLVEYARDGMPIFWSDPPDDTIRQSDYYDHGMPCPYGTVGDRLWVREKFSRLESFEFFSPDVPDEIPVAWYWADGDPQWGDWERPRPSIFMPRAFSRITLEITGVRVERVQDISEADAEAEGCPECTDCIDRCGQWGRGAIDDPLSNAAGGRPWQQCFGICEGKTEREWFKTLWHEINGKDSWDANPWVWIVEFKRIGVPS